MAKLGKALDLSKVLSRPIRNRIKAIGVELEGGWEKVPPGVELARDSSVKVSKSVTPEQQHRFDEIHQRVMRTGRWESDAEAMDYRSLEIIISRGGGLHTGELPSPVLEVGRKDRAIDISKVSNWVKTFYPSHVNETCGLHVHMSFRNPLTYSRLLDPRYGATILKYMEEWSQRENLPPSHPIWPRLRGESEYCQHTYWGEEQARTRNKDWDHHRVGNRYSVVAYRYAMWGTVEIRLLPMFESWEQSMRAIEEEIKITNAFLVATKKKEEKLIVEVSIPDDHHHERIIECV
jgi:hypothetical protein